MEITVSYLEEMLQNYMREAVKEAFKEYKEKNKLCLTCEKRIDNANYIKE